jgi:hypothetical protein
MPTNMNLKCLDFRKESLELYVGSISTYKMSNTECVDFL